MDGQNKIYRRVGFPLGYAFFCAAEKSAGCQQEVTKFIFPHPLAILRHIVTLNRCILFNLSVIVKSFRLDIASAAKISRSDVEKINSGRDLTRMYALSDHFTGVSDIKQTRVCTALFKPRYVVSCAGFTATPGNYLNRAAFLREILSQAWVHTGHPELPFRYRKMFESHVWNTVLHNRTYRLFFRFVQHSL